MPALKNVLIVGRGMIVQDQILPSLLHLQLTGKVGEIDICSTRRNTEDEVRDPLLYRERIGLLPERSIVFVATPDHLHHEMVMFRGRSRTPCDLCKTARAEAVACS